jgi:ferritin
MDKKIASLINTQVNKEFFSAYLYLSFANYYAYVGLTGFENWFNVQAREEQDHAMLFIKYLQNNDEKVTLEAIEKPVGEYAEHIAPIREALRHEKYITASINDIYSVAAEGKDYRTMQLLDWFVKEQGEEEKNVSDLINMMELFGTDPKSLYMLNSQLATRVYAAPSLIL